MRRSSGLAPRKKSEIDAPLHVCREAQRVAQSKSTVFPLLSHALTCRMVRGNFLHLIWEKNCMAQRFFFVRFDKFNRPNFFLKFIDSKVFDMPLASFFNPMQQSTSDILKRVFFFYFFNSIDYGEDLLSVPEAGHRVQDARHQLPDIVQGADHYAVEQGQNEAS